MKFLFLEFNFFIMIKISYYFFIELYNEHKRRMREVVYLFTADCKA